MQLILTRIFNVGLGLGSLRWWVPAIIINSLFTVLRFSLFAMNQSVRELRSWLIFCSILSASRQRLFTLTRHYAFSHSRVGKRVGVSDTCTVEPLLISHLLSHPLLGGQLSESQFFFYLHLGANQLALLSGHYSLPRGWLLNRGSTVIGLGFTSIWLRKLRQY